MAMAVLLGTFWGGVCVASKKNWRFDIRIFFSNMRENLRNKNPRPMDYSAGAGNGPFVVNTEMCGFGGFPPLFQCSGLVPGGGGGFLLPKKKKSSG